jgi:hypothetical protein
MVVRFDRWTLGLALLIVPAGAAWGAGPFYFQKANVDKASFIADFGECEELAGGINVRRQQVYSNNIYASAAGAFFAGIAASRERRVMITSVLRTCMTDKGYRRVSIPPKLRKELSGLSREQRIDRLFLLAAAPEPAGEVLPQ